jgi:pimeloyl-ACP methyl ester carboxylesterase
MAAIHEKGVIAWDGYPLHYSQTGFGSQLVLAFHGYGLSAAQMQVIANFLPEQYKLVCFDLPYHGDSQHHLEKIPDKQSLRAFAESVCAHFQVNQFSLLGYSLGGRFCLCLIETVPEYIQRITLLASDGLVFNPLYYMLTRTHLGTLIFKDFTQKPKRYLPIAKLLYRWNILHPSRYRFFRKYTQNPSDLTLLYNVWMSTRYLLPQYAQLRQCLLNFPISIQLIMGQKDPIIKPSYAIRFARLSPSIQVHWLSEGHNLLKNDIIPEIIPYLFPDLSAQIHT